MHKRNDSSIALRRISLPFWATFRVITVVGLLLSWLALSAHAAAPAVTNIFPQQRAGTKLVDITYDVSAVTPTVTVSLRISADDGATFTVPATTLSGAIGAGVTTGTGKVITWNAGADWARNYSNMMRFEVTADDALTPPSIITQPASTSIVSGSPAVVSVTASGTEPLTYQWYQGAVGDTATPVGTNSVSYTTPADLSADMSYWVRVSNAAGAVDSATVTLTAEFALIPTGNFMMGDATTGLPDERPLHTVNVSAFHMGKYEVTKALWDSVRTYGLANGYPNLPAGGGKGANHPVHSIDWYAMVAWCNARSQRDGLTPCYTVDYRGDIYKTGSQLLCNWNASGYRLPTEAEWEKAARGGLSSESYPWSGTISHSQANYYNHPTYATGSEPYSSPVGSFAPNGFGLFDMAGNMSEWVWDRYGIHYYASSPSANPRGPSSGTARVRRGGAWGPDAVDCRVARRDIGNPDYSFNGLGFRIARSSVPQ